MIESTDCLSASRVFAMLNFSTRVLSEFQNPDTNKHEIMRLIRHPPQDMAKHAPDELLRLCLPAILFAISPAATRRVYLLGK